MRRILLFLFLLVMLVFGLSAADYYVSTSGNDANAGTEAAPWLTIQKAATTLTAGDTVYIKAGTYAERVVPANSGSSGNYITYRNFGTDTVIIDGTSVTYDDYEGLFYMDGLNYIKVMGLKVQNAGSSDNQSGIQGDNCSYITVQDCVTYNTYSSGISFWTGSNITVDGNEVELACNNGEQECITLDNVTTFEVKNNVVHDNGDGSIGGEGIDAKNGSNDGKIYNNEVYGLTDRLGIYIDAWDSHTFDIEVYNNKIYNIVNNDGITLASEAGGLLENIDIYNNLVYGCAHNGINLSYNGDDPNITTRPLNNINIINNTFYNNGTMTGADTDWGGGIYIENHDATNVVIRNNIVSENNFFDIAVESTVIQSNVTIDHNLIFGTSTYGDNVKGTDAVEADPLFTDKSQADFTLQATSPAIDAGSATGAPATDYAGTARPQGSGIDIGAYEYSSGGSQTPVLALGASTMTLNATEGSTTEVSGTVGLTNTGGGSLNWSAAVDSGSSSWLSVSPASGTDEALLTISADPTGLSAGTYTGTITITDSGASNSPLTISVTFNVTATAVATISLSKTEITLAAIAGTTTAVTDTLQLANTGGGSLNWSAAVDSGSSSWLSVNPASGTSDAQLTISADPTGLSAGTYTGTITITDPGASNSPLTISVTFTVTAAAGGTIALSKTEINLAAVAGTTAAVTDTFTISNSADSSTLTWSMTSNEPVLTVSPSSGTGAAIVTVSVDPTGLAAGTYEGTITISASGATNSPQTLGVNLTVIDSSQDTAPFGTYETPSDGSAVYSNIPVSGWVLDDVGVESVKIYRNPVAGEGNSLIYIGDAVFVEGARPDVAAAYPNYPYNTKAGWGYMLLTNFLPNHGNGTFLIYAMAKDTTGNETTLGIRTIIADNQNAVKPFGTIDTPAQGGTASGENYLNWGWALTPLPNSIPTDGSTISVYVDSVPLGNPTYDIYRKDIATLFPGLNNTDGAVGYYYLDTTAYDNGVHNIAWLAKDSDNNMDGLGSRYFNILNTGSDVKKASIASVGVATPLRLEEIRDIPLLNAGPPAMVKGFKTDAQPTDIRVDGNNEPQTQLSLLNRLEVYLTPSERLKVSAGYVAAGDKLLKLPVGSTLDKAKGIFYWLPGPGFMGNYRFVFLLEHEGRKVKRFLNVEVVVK